MIKVGWKGISKIIEYEKELLKKVVYSYWEYRKN
jgi:hypothetical protein